MSPHEDPRFASEYLQRQQEELIEAEAAANDDAWLVETVSVAAALAVVVLVIWGAAKVLS